MLRSDLQTVLVLLAVFQALASVLAVTLDCPSPGDTTGFHCAYLDAAGYTYGVESGDPTGFDCEVFDGNKGEQKCKFHSGAHTTIHCATADASFLTVEFGDALSNVTSVSPNKYIEYFWQSENKNGALVGAGKRQGTSSSTTYSDDCIVVTCIKDR